MPETLLREATTVVSCSMVAKGVNKRLLEAGVAAALVVVVLIALPILLSVCSPAAHAHPS